MEADSYEYRLISRWVDQGMPYGSANDPVVTGIKCYPEGRVMDRAREQQIVTLATYSDGTVEDVTRMALYEPNDQEMAESSVTALVKTLELAGEVAIMARYQGQVSTFRATIPLGVELPPQPEPKNFIDIAVVNKLKLLGIPPSPVCDDGTFIRRATVDIAGRLPTDAETRAFIASSDPKKREALVDRWSTAPNTPIISRTSGTSCCGTNVVKGTTPKGTSPSTPGSATRSTRTSRTTRWFAKSSRPRAMCSRTPRGVVPRSPAVNEQVEDVAQLFLGLRIQCARCHHHPFEKWSQDDYYGFAAFFSRVGKKAGNNPREQRCSTTMAPPARPTRDRVRRRSRRASAAIRWMSPPSAIRVNFWPTGWPTRPIRSSLPPSSTAIGSTSSTAGSSNPKTTCGPPIPRRTPNCSMVWPSTSSPRAST